MAYPKHLIALITLLKRLPGVGNRSAERFAFDMLAWPASQLEEFAAAINDVPNKISRCSYCGCFLETEEESCMYCSQERLAAKTLCVVASPKDVYAIESTREHFGVYHVLGALLSPMTGIAPEILQLARLKDRIVMHAIENVVIAVDSTLEGDATALHIRNELADLPVEVYRIAFGLPMGSSLDYIDNGTLARAFIGRRVMPR